MTSPTTPPIPYFYPRPPRGGRPPSVPHFGIEWYISIHALREEGDACPPPMWTGCRNFYPRPPRGGRRPNSLSTVGQIHFYPRPPRGGRPHDGCSLRARHRISIHALCEEGDSDVGVPATWAAIFLSTPSARRATQPCRRRPNHAGYFYPRPLRGGRRSSPPVNTASRRISIHALCEEGDRSSPEGSRWNSAFLSTPSARRATRCSWVCIVDAANFYPRPLRGGRRTDLGLVRPSKSISIHALCEEGDSSEEYSFCCWMNFYPRPLRGGRRTTRTACSTAAHFYPRPLRGGRPIDTSGTT